VKRGSSDVDASVDGSLIKQRFVHQALILSTDFGIGGSFANCGVGFQPMNFGDHWLEANATAQIGEIGD
jgi:hypothetical protein